MTDTQTPLAARVRPQAYRDFVGQRHILADGCLLSRALKSGRATSLIFWGPAGCGKTTLGLMIARGSAAHFQYLNAAFTSVAQVKKIIAQAKELLKKEKRKTVVFIDELHKFNKTQQEALVPDIERANIHFIGTTIHTPFYYIIPSLISRSIVAQFKPLSREDIIFILKRAINDKEKGLGHIRSRVTGAALEHIALTSGGDARRALTALEIGMLSTAPDEEGVVAFDLAVAKACIQKNVFYDKADDYHYDTISAFIKSVRGSDVDSALYWLAKTIKGGEDYRFIARRLVILASEDIGCANPFALVLATSCFKAVEFVGKPEADLILAQATVYLAASPKSNAAYLAIDKAKQRVEEEETKEVPDHLKTQAQGYKYPHAFGGYVEQDYGVSEQYYFPKDIGEEKKIKEFLEGRGAVSAPD